MRKPSINLMSSLGCDTIGIVSINLIKQFHKLGIDISFFPAPIVEKVTFNNQEDYDEVVASIEHGQNLFDYYAPTLKIWNPHDLAVKPGKGQYFVWLITNKNDFSEAELHHLNFADGILVHSQYMMDILSIYDIKPKVYKIELGVDHNIFNSDTEQTTTNEKYIFYSIGRWSLINGHDFLLKAFDQAFTENDNVELRMLPYNEFLDEEKENVWLSIINHTKLKDKIFIYNKLSTQYDLALFISQANCYINTSRCAQSGLNILEAMSMNKPIICTKTGINSEFCRSGGAYFVDVDDYEQSYDYQMVLEEGRWAKLGDAQLSQTINLMRQTFKENVVNNKAGYELSKRYTWQNTANQIADIIF